MEVGGRLLTQCILAGAITCTTSLTVMAGPWSWMTESAVAQFTEEDIDIATTNIQQALNEESDGTVLEWRNADSGNSGSVKVFNSSMKNGQKCRNVLIFNDAVSVQGESTYFLCQAEDGKWQVTNRD